MEPDFSGWVTKSNIQCTDGRMILQNAFAHQDNTRVPLVWQHAHDSPGNVLGHCVLTNKLEGVWGDAYLNESANASNAREAVIHGDVTQFSIWANQLKEYVQANTKKVAHGVIREVSLVLAGANPGAKIDKLSIRHSDDDIEELDDEAIITSGEAFLCHATADTNDTNDTNDDLTVADVINAMTDNQKLAVDFLIQTALDEAQTTQTGDEMAHYNLFEDDSDTTFGGELTHADLQTIVESAKRTGSLKAATTEYIDNGFAHGIESVESLFPDPTALSNAPEWVNVPTEWVKKVFGGAGHTPFSRIKTAFADITYDEARAKGYIKGNMKKEQFFTLMKRVTTPTTVYKKQKLDRDDIVDITDFDVVTWLKVEMRGKLEEEIARAILVGDGRDVDDQDKIDETHLRPILTDDPFYTIPVVVPYHNTNGNVQVVIDSIILAMDQYRGSGTPTLFADKTFVTRARLLKDANGRRIYSSTADLASDLGVAEVVSVDVLTEYADVIGILVNMQDYKIGADKGGETSLFDDFDIDYNQYKYLIETRCSGALTKPACALAIRRTSEANTGVVADRPTQNKADWIVTIPTVTGVEYRDQNGNVVTGSVALDAGEDVRVTAFAEDGFYLLPGRIEWAFLRPTGS